MHTHAYRCTLACNRKELPFLMKDASSVKTLLWPELHYKEGMQTLQSIKFKSPVRIYVCGVLCTNTSRRVGKGWRAEAYSSSCGLIGRATQHPRGTTCPPPEPPHMTQLPVKIIILKIMWMLDYYCGIKLIFCLQQGMCCDFLLFQSCLWQH